MSRADLIATRDAAAKEFDIAQDAYQRGGNGENYRDLEAARVARRDAQSALDQHDRANPEPGGDCPKCGGEGGRFAEECPSVNTEYIECKTCEGTGEFWPEEKAS